MFLWVRLRLSIFGQASSSSICYHWLFITSIPLVMSLSLLLLFGFLSVSFLEVRARPPALLKEPSLGLETFSSISPTKKKNLSVVRAILTLCISPSRDKRLMSWHAHKIDWSFKDHTSVFSLLSPLTVNCLYLILLQTIPPQHALRFRKIPTFQAAIGFSLCHVMKINYQSVNWWFICLVKVMLTLEIQRLFWELFLGGAFQDIQDLWFDCQTLCLVEVCRLEIKPRQTNNKQIWMLWWG